MAVRVLQEHKGLLSQHKDPVASKRCTTESSCHTSSKIPESTVAKIHIRRRETPETAASPAHKVERSFFVCILDVLEVWNQARRAGKSLTLCRVVSFSVRFSSARLSGIIRAGGREFL